MRIRCESPCGEVPKKAVRPRLVSLLDSNLKLVLEGKVWEETPIDWMGYKQRVLLGPR